MPEPQNRDRPLDNALLLGLFILLAFTTPVMAWWAAPDSPWYLIYLIWFGVIALIARVNGRHGNGP